MARIEKIARETPGVAHTVGVSGQSLILNANAPNLGSMYVMLKRVRRAARRRADGRRDRRPTPRALPAGGARGAIVSAFGAPPIDGLGTTGGFKLIVEDRGNLGLDELQRVSDQIVGRGQPARRASTACSTAPRANTPWLYLDIDRTKCMALGVPVSDVFNTLQVYLGSYYVNNFNEFGRTWQVNVQADAALPRATPTTSGSSRCATTRGRWSGWRTLLDVRDTSGPVMVMRYNMYSAAADHRQRGAGHQLGPGDRADAGDRRPGAAAVDGLRVDRAGLSAAPGGQHGDRASSRWRWCSSSWCWRPSTRAGRCRWR